MATTSQSKQQSKEDNYLFAINSQEGDLIVKIGVDGSILYLKDGTTMQEAAKAFWNSFELFLPVTAEEVIGRPNDLELGKHVRARMNKKLDL